MLTRGRGEERRGEENLIPIDEDIFNPLSLCSIAGHTHGMEMRGRGDSLDDDGGSTLMHCTVFRLRGHLHDNNMCQKHL